ncbi:PIN-like domain-containing protein [Nonomuraea sp. NPDC003201]
MRLLLDENVPTPLHQVLTTFILNHEIVHLLNLDGWSGTRAAADGFAAILTNDGRQMQRPREVAAIAASGIHRVEYSHKHPGLVGMGIAIATVGAACLVRWPCWRSLTVSG